MLGSIYCKNASDNLLDGLLGKIVQGESGAEWLLEAGKERVI